LSLLIVEDSQNTLRHLLHDLGVGDFEVGGGGGQTEKLKKQER